MLQTSRFNHNLSNDVFISNNIINNAFRKKVEKLLGVYFSTRTMKTIKNRLMEKNTSVMELIMIYENNGEIPKQFYRVLSCVVYTIIDTYTFINYLRCQSKNLSAISCNPTFKVTSFNILLDIFIPELLLNLVSCHGFMKKPLIEIWFTCHEGFF